MHCLYEENKELQQRIDKLEEENKMYAQLKDEYEDIINKATEWVNNHTYTYKLKNIEVYDWDNLSNPKILLAILKGEE